MLEAGIRELKSNQLCEASGGSLNAEVQQRLLVGRYPKLDVTLLSPFFEECVHIVLIRGS